MHGFIVFGICFSLLAYVWYLHYRFFRRYGLENPWTVTLNCALLFFVLFYIYPLKFLFTAAFSAQQFSVSEGRLLYGIFGIGYAAVFSVFALLYRHAWRLRAELELTPIETLRTRQSLVDQVVLASFGLISGLLAQVMPPRGIGLAGVVYFACPFTSPGRGITGANGSVCCRPEPGRPAGILRNPCPTSSEPPLAPIRTPCEL